MDLHLAGKRALITGASKGIGRATALMLADEGCDLVLVSRTEATLAATADEIRSRHAVAVDIIAADLSVTSAIERVAAEAGALDILVNNAGAIPQGDLLGLDDAAWRSAWDLKVFGFIGLTRALYPRLKDRRGVVVNVIGAAGEWLDPNYLAGSTGNAALMAFTKTIGKAAPKDGCRVVGINPGPVETDRIQQALRARAKREWGDEERWREFYATMPFGRPASPEEIAAAVAFLASPRSAYTTGTILTIDGAPK
ncbi:SDR family oxidoreductase [Lichenihabitans sp. PAMC28606]|uniref:short-chain dehydrogenase/reductase n=1 Tax=Lichenihabitans sp. PAMC28606 TaxID=2880932 RepID=UPI001D0B9284|nr:short-chain dehydrogenase/reductase [Lichenihabitans sp. PAMC28606]UDL93440.1 SDR family oxidoreductase [Lichenihabitans sp. PAMC28606]